MLHGRALQLGLPSLGDVLVRADPAAALHRMIRDQQKMAALGLDLVHDGAPESNRGQKLLAVFLRVAGERALGNPFLQHVGQRRSRLYVARRQFVHFVILRVADDQSLSGVEHAQSLRHAVDGGAYLLDFPALTSGEHGTGQAHRNLGNDRGEDGAECCCGGG